MFWRSGIVLLLFLAVCLSLPAAARCQSTRLEGLPLDRAIRIGTGPQVVVEISDPDCRFSRRMVRYWDLRRDVTRFIFLVALKNHPEAEDKARYILCAADRAAAYREVYAGSLDFGEKIPDRQCDDRGLRELNRRVVTNLGVTGTPTYFIKGGRVNGAKVKEIERLLGGEPIPFSAEDPE